MTRIYSPILHVAQFLIAIGIFGFGLGVGLAINPIAGSVMVVIVIMLAITNLFWITLRFLK